MPLDGSYGRLNAHNERFKELRRKKLKRGEDKLKRNSLSNVSRGGKIDFEEIDPQKLELIMAEIRKKGKARRRKDIVLVLLSVIIACGISYFIYLNLSD
jgi:hypothetical protein